MNIFAGIAQDRATAASPVVGRGIESAPRSNAYLQLFAGLWKLDPETFAAGYRDGIAGVSRLTREDVLGGNVDVLAYTAGFRAGLRDRIEREAIDAASAA